MRKLPRMQFRDRWVLLTGASAGLGEEFARQLAGEHGARLILVARRKERLEELREQLLALGSPQVEVIASDLSDLDQVRTTWERAQRFGEIYAVIANAGMTHFGHFDELAWEGCEKIIDLNLRGTTWLVRHAALYLEKQKQQGGILIVASLAGLNPIAYQSLYSATKAYLVHLGCSLHLELLPRGVSVSVFCPGGIATEMTAGERFNDLRSWLVPVQPCARTALRAFGRRKYVCVPGLVYQLGQVLKRVLPFGFLDFQVARQYRASLTKNS